MNFISCLEKAEPEIDPCSEDGDWGKLELNEEEICFPSATAFFNNPNTSYSSFGISLGNFGEQGALSMSAGFSVPASGFELNKAYVITNGEFNGEILVSGEMTVLKYENNNDGSRCVSGTFHMITEDPDTGNKTNLTNGKFVYYYAHSDCNPF
jgi:hypothetical protein